MANFEAKQLLKDKKFWFASFLIAWAAALQGHMMWLQRQDSFKQKFGTIDQGNDTDERKSELNEECFVDYVITSSEHEDVKVQPAMNYFLHMNNEPKRQSME